VLNNEAENAGVLRRIAKLLVLVSVQEVAIITVSTESVCEVGARDHRCCNPLELIIEVKVASVYQVRVRSLENTLEEAGSCGVQTTKLRLAHAPQPQCVGRWKPTISTLLAPRSSCETCRQRRPKHLCVPSEPRQNSPVW